MLRGYVVWVVAAMLVCCISGNSLASQPSFVYVTDEAGNTIEKPIPDRPDQGRSLDEGCLAADSVTTILNAAHNHAILNFWAPQSGNYWVYSTQLPNNVSPPPGAGWVQIGTVNAGNPGHHSLTDTSALANFTKYTIIHNCPTPLNDACENLQIVTDGTYDFSTIGATTDGPDSACFHSQHLFVDDIWYRYTATCDVFSVSFCGSNYDNMVAIYDGWDCPIGLSEIACNDDYCSYNAAVTVAGISGHQYLIRVGGFIDSGTGVMTISPGARNDECTTPLLAGSGSRSFTTVCASTDGPLENYNGSLSQTFNDIWFVYYPQTCGPTEISLCGSTFDTKLAVYMGDCPTSAGTAIATSDDDCGATLQSTVTVDLADYGPILIRVGGFNGASGEGTLTITPPTPPANDLCGDATFVGPGTYNFSTLNACTDGPSGPINCFPRNDVWFKTQIAQCGRIRVDLCNSNFDTEVQIFHANDCSPLGPVFACNDDNTDCSPSTRSVVEFDTPDQGPYYIRIGGYNGARGTGQVTVTHIYTLLANDACNNAFTTDYGTFDVTNHCAGTDGDSTSCGQIYNDVWFTINAVANVTTTVSLCGSSINTRLAVYNQPLVDCSSLILLDCDDNTCGDDAECSFFRPQIGFGTYVIRVGGASFVDEGPVTMTITHN